MSDETTLLSCPFCGGEAEIQHQSRELYGDVVDWYGVYCKKQFCGYVSGQSTESEAIAAWNTRATHGTLTAEQVEKAIRDCSTYASYDGCTYYASGIGLQAIADELNAELGSNECEFKPFKDEDWDEPNAVRGVCSECSALMYGKDNYCPHCGARVRGGTE